MKNSFAGIRNPVREALARFLWDQWAAVGVSGSGPVRVVPFIIDPEALLLATTRFAATEPRLLEEVLDWLLLNGHWLSVQRLKNLRKAAAIGDAGLSDAFASRMVKSGHPGWKTLLQGPEGRAGETGEPGGRVIMECRPRGLSRSPDPSEPANFLFRMRALFGVNARPEVLAWLMCHERGYPAGIARETGWFSKSVQALLNDLERSGLVHVQPGERLKHFRLDHRAWEAFLVPSGRELAWFAQVPWYEGSRRILETVERIADAPEASDRLKAIWIRDVLPGIETAFQAAGQGGAFAGLSTLAGTGLVEAFLDRVTGWLGTFPGQDAGRRAVEG